MKPGAPLSAARIQRFVVAVDRGPGRQLLHWIYEVVARAYAAYLRRHEDGAAAYLRGTMATADALHGLSDIDVVIVLAPDPSAEARERVRARSRRITRRRAPPARLIDAWPMVYDEPGLAEVARRSALTYGLDSGGTAYLGGDADLDRIRMLERPELDGPAGWRLLAGAERRPAPSRDDPAARRIASWLELQNWWRWGVQACLEPEQPRSAYVCFKLIAEAARTWLWLTQRAAPSRLEALARAEACLPAKAEVFQRARRLHGQLWRTRRAPLEEVLPAFVRLSDAIAGELMRQVAPAGVTDVRLLGGPDQELALPHGGLPPGGLTGSEGAVPTLLPLLDWRGLVIPAEPDETFSLLPGDPGDPRTVAAVASALDRGPYLSLSADRLMVRPTPMGGRGRLRAIQCELSDPVSFALARGETTAPFANVPGWSIGDMALRALAEHRFLLAEPLRERSGTALGRLITAARAALLWESLREGEPQLPLTAGATLELLAAGAPSAAPAADSAAQAYRDFAIHWKHPSERVLLALRAAVVALPAYAPLYERAPRQA